MDPIYHTYLQIPFLNFIVSIIMIVGFYYLGSLIFLNKSLNKIFSSISHLKYQKVLISVNLILFFSYPIILFTNHGGLLLKLISFSILMLGLVKIFLKFKSKFKIKKYSDYEIYLVFFLLFGYFLISIAPPTSADSLDYHLYVAKILEDLGKYPETLNHFTSIIAGSGEILIAIGLNVGSEQLSSIIQFFGLISLLGILKKFNKQNIYILIVFSSPVLIFLISTLKPQLFHICSNAFVFALLLKNFYLNKFNLKDNLSFLVFSFIFIIVSIQAKFSFLLSSFILGFIILFYSYKKKILFKSIITGLIFLIFFYLPPLVWKFNIYGGDFYELFYSPITSNIHGHAEFKQMLQNVGKRLSYLWIIFPVSLRDLTQTLGLSSLFVLYLYKVGHSKNTLFIFAIIFFISVSVAIGQNTARFFLEPLIWTSLILSHSAKLVINKHIKYIIYLQCIPTILMLFYGVSTLSPSILTNNLRDKVMNEKALGYSFFQWVNYETKDLKDKIIYFHRSVGLSPDVSKVVPSDFRYYIFPELEKARLIFDDIKKIDPKYAAFYDFQDVKVYKKCLVKLYKKKEQIGYHATRNPLAKGNSYDGFIYEINVSLMPECINLKETKWKN